MRGSIGALLPAYNEERNIRAVIRETRVALPGAVIVVVDDGSVDRTAELAKTEHVVLLQHKINRGKGEALRTGFTYFFSRPVDAIVILDTDLQFVAAEATRLLKPILNGEADLIMGARNFSKIPLRHKLGNWVWRTTFNILFGTSLADTNCGFVALSGAAARKVEVRGGYMIENALLASAVRTGLKIAQVPVTVRYRRVSAVPRGIRVVLGVLWFIIVEGLKYRLGL